MIFLLSSMKNNEKKTYSAGITLIFIFQLGLKVELWDNDGRGPHRNQELPSDERLVAGAPGAVDPWCWRSSVPWPRNIRFI